MAQSVRSELGLEVRVVLGPHPAAFAHQFINWVSSEGDKGSQKAIENYRSSIDEAVKFYHEGQAHAIGEVGRPHWKFQMKYGIYQSIITRTMSLAATDGFVLQLHVEGELESTYRDMAEMATRLDWIRRNWFVIILHQISMLRLLMV